MRGQHENMTIGSLLEERGADKRPGCELERAVGGLAGQGDELFLGDLPVFQNVGWYGPYPLNRCPGGVLRDDGAQPLVPLRHIAQCGAQRYLRLPAQVQHGRYVLHRARTFKLD